MELNCTQWGIFDNWSYPKKAQNQTPDWNVFLELFSYHRKIIEKKYELLNSLLDKWDLHLSNLGGDSTHYDWAVFRPLRLTREEDWSDWIAHLLATSNTGKFAHWLLQIPQLRVSDYALPKKVEREVSYRNFRADIIVQWQNKYFTHIEVKVGDEHLRKTYETSKNLMEKYGVSNEKWTNFILLLPRQLMAWGDVQITNNDISEIKSLTWGDVCVAIRQALLSEETITWKVWAYSFLGAIEQLLIDFPGHRLLDKPTQNVDEKIAILRGGLNYE